VPREREGSRFDELTASDRRVAELAAKRYTDPEIAQALFVTRTTVETHLGHGHQKLAISSRGKLTRAGDTRVASILIGQCRPTHRPFAQPTRRAQR
jgi:DNA-binding CsgD family transcriptional regulator